MAKNENKSQVKAQGFSNFLSTLFGWRRKNDNKGAPVEFVNVDVNSAQRLAQANVEELLKTGKLSDKLNEIFQSWLNDTTDSLQEISDRRKRVDQLTYAKMNDPFIGRVVQLFADEATQLDVQDKLIGIETPDPRMTKEMYRLLNQWGVTQQRCRSALDHLATYGDSFWAHKISENGVERVIPLKQLQVTNRLEFNPVEALEKLKRRDGSIATLADRHTLIKTMLKDMEDSNDFADIFDTKLFGFSIQGDFVVPPWAITHFRAGSDGGEFFPYGTSPILGTLAPFKLTASTITLQSIARVLSFPVTLYKVKTSDSADEARQFSTVNRVREEYDNIGVTPAAGNSEVYTVNTKIWMPEGLMDVDVKSSQVDMDFVGDIEMYQDRVAVATGVPKGYLVQEWGGFGNSAISLVEQFKPFARSVYTLQTAFLDGLSNLFRLHFAINGQFDYRVPFTLSLRYPAEEESDEKRSARTDSLRMASDVMDMIRAAIGADDEEGLPPDIIRDIIAKYTFLDPVDIVKWTKDAKYGLEPDDIDSEFDDDDMGFDLEADMEEEEPEADEGGFEAVGEDEVAFGEQIEPHRPNRLREERLQELRKRYRLCEAEIYFKTLREYNINSFIRKGSHIVTSLSAEDSLKPWLESIADIDTEKSSERLQEMTYSDMVKQTKEDNDTN